VNKFLRRTMPTFLLKPQARGTTRSVLFLITMSLSLGATLFVVNAYNKRGANLETTVKGGVSPTDYETVNAPPVTLAQGEDLHVILVTLTARGFDPPEILSSKGRFILAIENISGFPDTSISLVNNSTQAVVQTTQMPSGKVDWLKAFDLPAGTYVLNETSHPGWTCTLTVNPQ
jgi:hypothetical protein